MQGGRGSSSKDKGKEDLRNIPVDAVAVALAIIDLALGLLAIVTLHIGRGYYKGMCLE